jgi:hypothetical protein
MPARFQLVLVLLLVTLSGHWSAVHAEIFRLKADLTKVGDAPAGSSAGGGQGEFVFDTSTNQLVFTVVYQGLTGAATAVRILRPVAPGENEAVVVTFPVPDSPISGTFRLSDTEAATLLSQRYYVNVETKAFPKGEIRGQIVK